MDKFQIETAQNVKIAQNIATLGDRTLAFLLDSLILLCYEIVTYIIFMSFSLFVFHTMVIFMVFGLVPFLYYLVFEAFNNGQTLGKAALSIRVVKIDGTKPAFSNYLIRWLLRIVDFNLTLGGCAIFTFLLNGKGQRLGDIAANTTVISEKKRIHINQTLMVEIPEDYVPKYPHVTVFTDKEIQTIKELYKKAWRKKEHEVIAALAEKVAKVLEINQHEQFPADFIKRVVSDYNYYTQK